MTTIHHHNKQLPWLRLRATPVYGGTHKYLEDKLMIMILYQNGKSRFYPSAYDLSRLGLLTSIAVLELEFLPVEKA